MSKFFDDEKSVAILGNERFICKVLAWFSWALAILLPLAVALPFLATTMLAHAPARLSAAIAKNADFAALPWYSIALVSLVALLPVLSMSRALWIASRCFRDFAASHYFLRSNAQRLRALAGWLLTAAILGLLATPLISLITSLGRGGPGSFEVSLDSQQILMLIFTGLVWQISRIFAKAVALAEENAQFV
jgi:Protein of unknown function (DUF2975)